MKILKSISFGFLLFCCLSWCSDGFCYEITEAELSRLEINLGKLEKINTISQQKLNSLQAKLESSEKKSEQLEKKLLILSESSVQQEKLLASANQSLKEYEQETNKKVRRLKWQRTMWQVIAVGCLAWAIERSL